jgi:hypothetical protein
MLGNIKPSLPPAQKTGTISLDGRPTVPYLSQMRNINNLPPKTGAFHPLSGANALDGGGCVHSRKTSNCGELTTATTSGVLLRKKGRGAPPGNRRALKHGAYTAEKQVLKRQIALFVRRARDVAEMVEVQYGGKPRRRRKVVAT